MSMWNKWGQCEESVSQHGERWGVLERVVRLSSQPQNQRRSTERTVCPASDRSWDLGNNPDPHSPLQLSTARASPVRHWPISMGHQAQEALLLWSIPGHHWSEKKPGTSGFVKNLGFLWRLQLLVCFCSLEEYSKSTLAGETAKGSWKWTCNVLLICWGHLEWVHVERWRINWEVWTVKSSLISEKAMSWCISLELMLPSSSVGTSLKSPCKPFLHLR